MAEPDDAQRLQIALAHHRAGRLQSAEALYREILARDPSCVGALHHLGVVAHQLGDHPAAAELIRQAALAAPNQPAIHSNLGEAYRHLQRFDEAIASFRQALALQANRPDTLNNLGLALGAQGRTDEAIACFRRAIALQPGFGQAHYNLGAALIAQGRHDDAVPHFQRAAALHPEAPEIHCNLGCLLAQQGRSDEALACFQQALALQPNFPNALDNLGSLFCNQGRLDEALACYRRARSLAPDRPDFQSNVIQALLYHPHCSAAEMGDELRRWQDDHARPLTRFVGPHDHDRTSDRPLRVGYVSPDFRLHAVAFFLLPLLEAHDRRGFHVTCYFSHVRSDDVTARFRAWAAEWRSLVGVTDEAAAAMIRRDRIDILVDLSGHMAGNRLPLFARKPAPIQVSFLGFPGSTGLGAIDYRLTDALADPVGAPTGFYPEALVRLPETAWCFAPLSGSPPVADSPAARHGYVTFGCFNNFAKITDDVLRLWARILFRVPRSRLTLKNQAVGTPSVASRLRSFFAQQGIATDRLQLVAHQAAALDHLRCYDEVDLAVDTFPYHGTTTTCEALWMGVPVVTLCGQTHAARVGVSLLTNAGLPEFIADGFDAYVEIAAAAGLDLARLASLRERLRARMQRSPLMDAPRFASSVESAYRVMWQRRCAQPEPATGPKT